MSKLFKVQKSIDKFLKRHPSNLSRHGHKTLRRMLNNRAKALSKASGMKIHSLFD